MENNLASLLRDFAQGASNSAATNLSMPVDAIAWLLRKGGMNIPNNPVGGSDWLAEKGFTPEPKNKLAGLLGDVAGFAAPLATVTKAPQIAKGLLQMGEAMPMGSKGVPTLSKSSPMADRGAVNVGSKFEYPQSQALELAQQRAALPVSEGGLGLPANNTAMDRANAMGAEFGWGHGSSSPNIEVLKSSTIGAEGKGAYATDYLPETGVYSGTGNGATSYPLAIFRDKTLNVPIGSTPYELLNASNDIELASALKNKNLDSITAMQKPTERWLIDAGAENLPIRRHFVSENPDNFRSRFAAFDPWRRNAAIAASMGVAAPDLLANPLDDKNNRLIDILRSK